MTYAVGIRMFMAKLNQLINCNNNDIPSINNPKITSKRPQFQLLYDDLANIIQTLSILQQLNNDLMKTFTQAAEEAQYIVDRFLSAIHIQNTLISSSKPLIGPVYFTQYYLPPFVSSPFLNLDDVRRSLESLKVEFMSMRLDSLSPKTEKKVNQSAPISISRSSVGSLDGIIVGFDRDADIIREKLVEDQKKVDVVSIVGMGGIGKTTLATKVFNDGYVKHHFYVRVWVTVSQTYDKRAVLTHILESICNQLDLEKASDSRLRELVHKNLMGKRYLIVIDDIWHMETWDTLKVFFPHDNNGSRILLTSRQIEVAKHANSDGLIHHIRHLNKESSWELLCQNVFHGNECPEWATEPGMQIAENCHGLPLALVVVAGVLANHAWSKRFWKEMAECTRSYIVDDQNGCMETLALSYIYLPLHLRECFLYLGGLPEDYTFEVERLIRLWVAEGFVEEDGNRSLEDIAQGYLMDLIDRNLVIVAERRKSNREIRACKVHDLVRELCIRKAKEEQFILITESLSFSSQFSDVITKPYNPVRMFINKDINILGFPYPLAQSLRSILCFRNIISLHADTANGFRSFVLIRVLDLQNYRLDDFPKGMELLVHLRYLAIWNSSTGFPPSLCNLWCLQTLIYITQQSSIDLPCNISDLINLRHLWTFSSYDNRKIPLFLTSIEKPMNLQTISCVELGNKIENLQTCFPYIKELTCTTYSEKENDFQSLTYLEKLKLIGIQRHIAFPASLKSLTLNSCHLPWSDMSIIQSLPNLEVLKLKHNAFVGSCWNTNEHVYQQLKFLKLEGLNIKHWEAYTASFPCLKQLEIFQCFNLEEIPLEIGYIPLLDHITINCCSNAVGESVRRIEEEQRDLGNYDLKIHIIKDIWGR